jgi:predicted small secreted protein
MKKSVVLQRLVYNCCFILLAASHIVTACPNCKEGFDKNTANASIGSAYSLTIYFLLVIPIAIVTVLVVKIRRQMQMNDKTDLYRA